MNEIPLIKIPIVYQKLDLTNFDLESVLNNPILYQLS